MLINIYTLVLYQPIFNLLVFFYNLLPNHDLGLAIVLITIVIRILILPLSAATLKSQKRMQEVQPKLEELKQKYKDDQEKMTQEMMKLYKDEKVNPFSSCLPVLLQLPIFIAVYQVFQSGLKPETLKNLYPFVSNPGVLNSVSLGLFDLSKPSWVLAFAAGLGQYFQSKMLMVKAPGVKGEGTKDEETMAIFNKQMTYMFPVITVIIGFRLPAGLTLYWLITTLFSLAQQIYVLKKKKAAQGAV